ncbi:CHASE2 domain-containing protein, partial [Candidatus Peregrinibacteria bacterium]|nr:CHASE2 domain-containing protein [Candidatus Peregrinibacteria bacterium]
YHLKISNLLFAGNNSPNPEIIVIAIDDASINDNTAIKKNSLGRYWDWSRLYHRDVLENLEDSGAKVVAFDLAFNEMTENISTNTVQSILDSTPANQLLKSFGKYTPNFDHPEDIEFAESLGKFDNIVLFATPSNPPIDIFTSNVDSLGLPTTEKDSDGLVRRVPFEGSFTQKIVELYNPDLLTNVPLEDGDLIINYSTPPYEYNSISYKDIYFDTFDPQRVKDKIALIGVTTPSVQDHASTPIKPETEMPGIEIHANAIQTILEQNFLHNQTKPSQIITLAALTIIGAVALVFSPLWLGILLVIFMMLGYYAAAHMAYANGIIINMIYPFLAIVLTYIGSIMYKYFAELRQRQYLQTAFGRYLSPDIMKEVLKNPQLLHRSGMKREITVFFSDIAGFTTVSEKLEPTVLLDLVNDYLGAMTDIVLQYHGTLDKYVGDAIVAYFGAPLKQNDHAHRACSVALAMREKLPTLHEKWQREGKPLIDFRIGINTGEAIVGNVGSEKRFDYTIMGDEVNLGSRLEGANKRYGTRIMVSEQTYAMVQDEFIFRPIDIIKVKGKNKAIEVFELVAHTDRLSETGEKLLTQYNNAISLYRNREFKKAYEAFKKALEIHPDDEPSKLYVQRSDILSNYPPPENWDGVFTMKTK